MAWGGSAVGWSPAWYSEIDRFAIAVLADRHGGVPNLGDMTAIDAGGVTGEHGPVDVLVGGTPCQSFSVAGLRKGLADPRGNLALEYLRLADALGAEWLVWENVPGVLSSNGGRDFGAFLGALGELGYGWSYRVLDAQFFGLAQRRKRVFVVAHLGDPAGAAAVLVERSCLRGDPRPSREAGSGVAAGAARGALGEVAHTLKGEGHDGAKAEICADMSPTLTCVHDGAPIAFDTTQVTSAQNRSRCEPGSPSPSLAAGAHAPAVAFNYMKGGSPASTLGVSEERVDALRADAKAPFAVHHRMDPIVGHDLMHSVDTDATGPGAVCLDRYNQSATAELSHTLASAGRRADRVPAVHAEAVVRRLTPVECERLMGFPDDYTRIAYRGKPAERCPDGPRYRALGNSIAVPVLRWIGDRINAVRAAQGATE